MCEVKTVIGNYVIESANTQTLVAQENTDVFS